MLDRIRKNNFTSSLDDIIEVKKNFTVFLTQKCKGVILTSFNVFVSNKTKTEAEYGKKNKTKENKSKALQRKANSISVLFDVFIFKWVHSLHKYWHFRLTNNIVYPHTHTRTHAHKLTQSYTNSQRQSFSTIQHSYPHTPSQSLISTLWHTLLFPFSLDHFTEMKTLNIQFSN